MTKLNDDQLNKVAGAGGASELDDPAVGHAERPEEDDSSSSSGGSGGGGTPIGEDGPGQGIS